MWTDVLLHSPLMQPPPPVMPSLITLGKVFVFLFLRALKMIIIFPIWHKRSHFSLPHFFFHFHEYRCFVDARITGSDSKFLARTEENKLRFQLEAFRFQNSESGVVCFTKTSTNFFFFFYSLSCSINPSPHLLLQIYITCQLRATSTSTSIDSQNRACSYSGR